MPGDGPSLRGGGGSAAALRHPPDRTARGARVGPGAPRPDQALPTAPCGEGPSVTRVSRVLVCDAHVQRRSAIVTSVSHPRRPSACALLGDTWSPPSWCPRGPWVFPERSPGFCVFLPLEGAEGELHPASCRVLCGEGRRCLSLGEAVGERWCLVAHRGCRGAGRSLGCPQVQIPEHPGASPEALLLVTPGVLARQGVYPVGVMAFPAGSWILGRVPCEGLEQGRAFPWKVFSLLWPLSNQ